LFNVENSIEKVSGTQGEIQVDDGLGFGPAGFGEAQICGDRKQANFLPTATTATKEHRHVWYE
jgi:hypothetical protein